MSTPAYKIEFYTVPIRGNFDQTSGAAVDMVRRAQTLGDAISRLRAGFAKQHTVGMITSGNTLIATYTRGLGWGDATGEPITHLADFDLGGAIP